MQQIPAWARRKKILFAAAAMIFGAVLLAWPFVAGLIASTPAFDEAITLQETDDAGLDALSADRESAPDQQTGPALTPATESVIVYISGAVHRPDVYQLPAIARVKDVVLAAGGLADDADPDQINLADHVVDGQHIYIPHQDEALSAPSPAGDGGPATGEGTLLNINTSSAAELESLPGIGQSFAQRIVEYRTANGPFPAVEDLRNVKGIGPTIFEEIAPLVTVGP